MATLSNVTLSIVRDVANADLTVEYDVTWSAYDQLTNLPYSETWRLIGDDTGQDGDDSAHPGDDAVNIGLVTIGTLSSNGRATTHRTKTRTIEFADLDEDSGDDEIRAIVTLTPMLPVATNRESNAVTVNA